MTAFLLLLLIFVAVAAPGEVWDGVEGRRRGGGGGGRLVTRAKKARSDFRGGQGRVPRRPRPREGVVATIRVTGGRGGGMEVDEGGMVGGWGIIVLAEAVKYAICTLRD